MQRTRQRSILCCLKFRKNRQLQTRSAYDFAQEKYFVFKTINGKKRTGPQISLCITVSYTTYLEKKFKSFYLVLPNEPGNPLLQGHVRIV